MLLIALVVSHLQYSAVLLNGITENLMTTLEKQLNGAIEACFFALNTIFPQILSYSIKFYRYDICST